MATQNEFNNKLGLVALTAIVVSSMIGAGIDALPQNMAAQSAVMPVFIAWCIAGFGILFIALTFILLNDIKPDLKDGIYFYSKVGFGNFAAFLSGWGYWLMCIFSNVAYGVMLMGALNYFVPGTFTDGSNLASIVGITLLIWGFNYIVSSGVKEASLVNIVGTFAKLIPLVIFVIGVVYFIRWAELDVDIWGHHPVAGGRKLGSIFDQITAPLDIALWCFIGIEGAVVLSARAKDPATVKRATLLGFLISLILCMLVSILPFGLMTQPELAVLETPSTAGVFNYLFGKPGEFFISIGVVISVLSAWLAWTLLCAEVPMTASDDGTFPKIFKHINKKEAPNVSVGVSSAIMQLSLILVYFAADAWTTLLTLSAILVLPAYLGSTLYLLKISFTGEVRQAGKNPYISAIVAIIGAIFCVFMFCISGFEYILMVPIALTVGIPLYMYARYENRPSKNIPIFTLAEKWGLAILLVIDIVVCVYFYIT